MALFGRRGRSGADDANDEVDEVDGVDEVDEVAGVALDAEDEDADEAALGAGGPADERVSLPTTGPYDVADVPADDAVPRIDLGGMRVPVADELEVRVDVDGQQVVAATLATPASAMQIGVFAAPRTTGIWGEIRAEISEQVTGSGGRVREEQGPFGVELVAHVPTATPGIVAPTRFVGVNGPRWFLRALLQGRAAVEGLAAEPALEAGLRRVVIVRGGEAMPSREALALQMPKEALAALAEAGTSLPDGQGAAPAAPPAG